MIQLLKLKDVNGQCTDLKIGDSMCRIILDNNLEDNSIS